MAQPPIFPLKPPVKPGLFRQTPPAVFPPLLGLLGLGLGWRTGAALFGVSPGLIEMGLGAASLLWVYAALAYLTKLAHRPGVVLDDLQILPGRAGLSTAVLGIYLQAMILAPYAPDMARGLLFAGLAVQVVFVGLLLRVMWAAPPEARGVTPVWHLSFVGFIVGGLAASALGESQLAVILLFTMIPVAAAIWGASVVLLLRRIPPAPLRPLLAIHLAPASLLAAVAAAEGRMVLATAFALFGAAILAALVLSARWIAAAGFSALWGALTFPLAAYANALLALGGPWRMPGGIVLVAATLIIPPIVLKVMQAWAKGQLAARTNAAVA